MGQGSRENEGPLPEPIAYFLTWATYGTWLPGDERGWVEYRHGCQLSDPARKLEAEARMAEDACILDGEQRQLVEATIRSHCQIRGWTLHAVNCRTNHLHVVVTADRHPDEIREQFKAWCTRKLKELDRSRQNDTNPTRQRGSPKTTNPTRKRGAEPTPQRKLDEDTNPTRQRGSEPTRPQETHIRENWWAERGSKRFINDEDSLEAAILYVTGGQDRPH